MTIEQEVFRRRRFEKDKMTAYGFACEKDCFVLEKDFMDGDFRAEITVDEDGNARGRVIDKMNDEEYAPLRIPGYSGAYVNSVRAAYEELLNDIADNCCTEVWYDCSRFDDGPAGLDMDTIRAVLSIADNVPEGRVVSYGRIAEMIGRPKNARLVGRIMSMADRYGDHPCHRVVNHAGRTVPGWEEQREMLEKEGVEFKINGCVNMKKHQI